MGNYSVAAPTAGYVSLEQARGLPVDKRTDIWAFGCVLYEMLTGRQAFHGAAIIQPLLNVVRSRVRSWRGCKCRKAGELTTTSLRSKYAFTAECSRVQQREEEAHDQSAGDRGSAARVAPCFFAASFLGMWIVMMVAMMPVPA